MPPSLPLRRALLSRGPPNVKLSWPTASQHPTGQGGGVVFPTSWGEHHLLLAVERAQGTWFGGLVSLLSREASGSGW